MKKPDFQDVLAIVGMLFIVYGVFVVFQPAAFVLSGLFILRIAHAIEKAAK